MIQIRAEQIFALLRRNRRQHGERRAHILGFQLRKELFHFFYDPFGIVFAADTETEQTLFRRHILKTTPDQLRAFLGIGFQNPLEIRRKTFLFAHGKGIDLVFDPLPAAIQKGLQRFFAPKGVGLSRQSIYCFFIDGFRFLGHFQFRPQHLPGRSFSCGTMKKPLKKRCQRHIHLTM